MRIIHPFPKLHSGFFSNCQIRLFCIINFINENKHLPEVIDSSQLFRAYKKNTADDITYDYFTHYHHTENIQIINHKIEFHYIGKYQYQNYLGLDYTNIIPIVKKYFSPSIEINEIIKTIEKKYNLQYDNICVLFYRGNDKNRETSICTYEEYLNYANIIFKKNPNIVFLIQSDETEFIQFMIDKFPTNSFYFKDEIRHMKKNCLTTVDIVMSDKNYEFSKYFLAITIIMSKCKYIICGTGNISMWIMFYRGNNNNVYQNLDGIWYNNIINDEQNKEFI